MNKVSEEEINCVFEGQQQIAIFDQDNWTEDLESSSHSLKTVPYKVNVIKENETMMKKISEEMENSKQNFCKLKIVCQPNKKAQVQNKMVQSKKKIEMIGEKNPNSVLKQGMVEKKTDGIFFKWHRRYMVLTVDKIYFFSSPQKQKVIGCINLKILRTKIEQSEGNLVLNFDGQCENLILQFQKKQDLKQWKSWLQKVVSFHLKEIKLMLKTMMKPLYDSKDSITEKQFVDSAETGDILLFHTKNTGAIIQRVLTNSEYDHVAMVVKFRKKEVMVFQSNAINGVSVFEWNQYIRYFDLYEKVSVRKLNSVKKTDLHYPLLTFVKKNLGKSYEIGASKLLKLESDFSWESVNKELKQEEEKSRGYFCSELIAKAYKSVGLIDSKKSSGRYWPVDFSDKGEMVLKVGAWLGAQQSIILNKHVKNSL